MTLSASTFNIDEIARELGILQVLTSLTRELTLQKNIEKTLGLGTLTLNEAAYIKIISVDETEESHAFLTSN